MDTYKTGVLFGSYNKEGAGGKAQLVDVSDMAATEEVTKGKVSAIGAFVHEVAEGVIGQNTTADYGTAHNKTGEVVQAKVDGYESIDQSVVNGVPTITIKEKGQTTTIELELGKKGKDGSQDINLKSEKVVKDGE